MQQHTKPWGSVMIAGVVAAWVGLWETPAIAKFLAPVEVTGQTQCWDEFGTPLPSCTNTGQDGAIQAGVRLLPPRFSDNNNDGTVTDNLTGLIWLKDAGCLGGGTGRTWGEALAAVADLANGSCDLKDYSKRGDWRLPNIKELHSLIHFSSPQIGSPQKPALPPEHPFVHVEEIFFYWSSTTRVDQPRKAWGVDLEEGTTIAHFKFAGICNTPTSVRDSFGVWAVKGPVLGGQFVPAPVEVTGQTQCWNPTDRCPSKEIKCKGLNAKGQDGQIQAGVRPPTPRFDDLDDGTVLDKLTGLIWLKDASCLGSRPWAGALAAIDDLNAGEFRRCKSYTPGTFTNWRLPNVKELQSLIDFGQSSPSSPVALPPKHPFEGVGAVYHSSTTREQYFPDDAWAVTREGITHPDTEEASPPCQCLDPLPPTCDVDEVPSCVCSQIDASCATKHEGRRVWAVRGGVISIVTP